MSEIIRYNLGLPKDVDDYVCELSENDRASKNSVIVSCIKRQKIINEHIDSGGVLIFKNSDGTEKNIMFI